MFAFNFFDEIAFFTFYAHIGKIFGHHQDKFLTPTFYRFDKIFGFDCLQQRFPTWGS